MQPPRQPSGVGAALVIVLILAAGVFAYYHGVRAVTCPKPVVVHGYTLSCDGTMPAPDPSGRP
jgi:hypothetical protein